MLEGGQGAGTVVTWKLQATKSRLRDVKAAVDVAGKTVIEKDANSTLVTNWTVAPAGTGSTVTVKTSWTGAGGVKGFFEKTFAPLGLRKIQDEVLGNLKKELEGYAVGQPGGDVPRHAPRRTSAGPPRTPSVLSRPGSSYCRTRPGSTGTAPG